MYVGSLGREGDTTVIIDLLYLQLSLVGQPSMYSQSAPCLLQIAEEAPCSDLFHSLLYLCAMSQSEFLSSAFLEK